LGFRPLANALDSGASGVTVHSGMSRNETSDFLAVTLDHDFFAVLDEIKQVTKFILCLEGTELVHSGLLFNQLKPD